MGEKITLDEENDYPIYKPLEKKGVKEHLLSLSVCEKLDKCIQILETKQGLLVTFSLN